MAQVPPSARFQAALNAGGFDVRPKIEVYKPGVSTPLFSSLLSTVPTNALDLYITNGSVTFDKKQDVRSQCSLTFVSPNGTYLPKAPSDIFTPWGNELRIYWGIVYPDGTYESVLMGVFRISRVAIEESGGAPVMTLTGYDRSRNISRNVVMEKWPPSAQLENQIINQSIANLIQVMCQDRYPLVQFNDTQANWTALQNDQTLTAFVIPSVNGLPVFSEGTDLWSQSRQYAQVVGCDLYFDRRGILTMVKDINFITMSAAYALPPVASFTEGSTAMFDKISRVLDDQAAFNGVIAYGAGTVEFTQPLISSFPPGSGTSLLGTPAPAIDNDPNSPTYWYGPYGQVPHVASNNLITTQSMLDNYAILMLIIDLGAQESVSIPSMAVNPLIDVDDVVSIKRVRDGIPQPSVLYIVDSLTVPLVAQTAGQMVVREKRNLVL